jgi:uncharacterized RDD family membrane protein YckC
MQCGYCREWNEEDERRCARCGRRLRPSLHENYPISTSTAPALEALPGGDPLPEAARRGEHPIYQPSLFRDASGGPKVIPIPTLTPVRPSGREEAPATRRAPRPRAARHQVADSQQSLDFYQAYGGTPSQQTVQTEAVIYCDAPVALPAHRVIAAAFDASMVLIAVGLFLGIFFLSGGMLVLSRQNIPFLLGVAAVLALFYRTLFCLANGDTPGTRFAGLKLVDFDGRPPDREQRGLRQLASLLSLGSAGLGLVWALVDEESLTWHDHISKTFPTSG